MAIFFNPIFKETVDGVSTFLKKNKKMMMAPSNSNIVNHHVIGITATNASTNKILCLERIPTRISSQMHPLLRTSSAKQLPPMKI